MPKKEQVPTEKYNVNDKIRACIISVEKGVKGSTQIILSRASTEFVRKLFEIEIPESQVLPALILKILPKLFSAPVKALTSGFSWRYTGYVKKQTECPLAAALQIVLLRRSPL